LPGFRRPAKFPAMTSTGLDAVEARAAAAGGAGKRAYVRRMFSEIAPRYDLLNRLLSLNIDRGWRRSALSELDWPSRPEGTYLDLCAGTLDVGAMLARTAGFRGMVMGADFAEPMLRRGVGKADPRTLAPVTADAVSLPIADASLSGAIVAFGVRNLADLDAGLREVHRVLAPGGRFVILEFSTPPLALVRGAFHAYSHVVLPAIGRVVSGHPTAYRYLPESVDTFPTAAELADRMSGAGFVNVRWRHLTFGVVAIHVGVKGDGGRGTGVETR
jgi:demethylmenaquinone methyltransferase/2-methoxy-6-polyprenyl-1,4-benzoquinol methylase